jgi:glycerol uptake facilitator-like aquaporin
MDDKTLRSYMVELIGAFALVFVSAGAVLVSELGGLQPGSVGIALAAGLIYAGALAFTLPVSEGYLNPAVVVVLWVFKRLDGSKALALIGAQVLGAVLAGLAVRFLFTGRQDVLDATRVGAPYLHLNAIVINSAGVTLIPLLKGIAIELVITFVLVFAIFALILDPRAPRVVGPWANRLNCLWLGVILAAVTFAAYPITGAAANPARWLGPAVAELTVSSLNTGYNPFRGDYADHSVYWIGPIAGALIAGWLYSALLLPSEQERAGGLAAPVASKAAVSSTLFRARR